MKLTLKAISAILFAALSAPVMAGAYTLGTIPTNDAPITKTVDIYGASSFNDSFDMIFKAGTTAVNFTFGLGDAGSAASSFSAGFTFVPNPGGVGTMQSFTPTNLSSYDSEADMYSSLYKFSLTPIAGHYIVDVSGTYVPDISGKQYSLTVSAVPEPESYALLLAGLGLMTGITRRRNKTSA